MIAMIAVVVVCTIFELIGLSIFQVPEQSRLITIGEHIDRLNLSMITSTFILAVTMIFITLISTGTKLKVEVVATCALLSLVSQLKVHPIVPTSIVFIICLIYGRSKMRFTISRYINLMVITGGYQFLASIYKFGFYKSGRDFTASDILLFSIDNIALLIAINLDRKGGERHEKENIWLELVYPFAGKPEVFPGDGDAVEAEDSQIVLSYGDKVLMVLVSIFQLGVVAAAVTINSRFIVWLIVYLFGYFPQKVYTGFGYHAATLLGCTLQSIAVFYVACAIVPEVGISVLLPVISGVAIIVFIRVMSRLRGEKGNGD